MQRTTQAEQLVDENEKNVAKYKCELVAETGEVEHSDGDGDAAADEEKCNDTSVSSEHNASGDGGETYVSGNSESETGEVKSTNEVMEVTVPADVSSTQKNVTHTDVPSGLDQLEQPEKLDNNLNSAEQCEPGARDTTTAGQSVSIRPPTDADGDRELLQSTHVKLNEVQDDDIDVIDLSSMTVQSNSINSSQHVTACFEVRLLQLVVLCTLTVS